MNAVLLLEDGKVFEGISIGVPGERVGEVVLNTAVVGYQEMMTDTTNAGKILVLTYPLIGNYGIADRFNESERPWIGALIIKEESGIYSNWQAESSFGQFLKSHDLVAMSEVDTRTLAVRVRHGGEMLGIVSTNGGQPDELLKRLRDYRGQAKKDFIPQISVDRITEIAGNGSGPTIAILDLGIHNSFLRQLKNLGCRIRLLPYNTPSEAILGSKPNGLIVSNGPEEDEAIPRVVETVRSLLGKIPLLGISTGHEIICLALGGQVKKMKVGHHGANYPVISPSSFKGDITFQNHSWVVDEEILKGNPEVNITLRNLNDQSVEEIESPSLRILSTQYYPVSPGFDEIHPVFERFLRMIKDQ